MNITEFLELCEVNNIDCGEREAQMLSDFADFLLSENEHYNLTAIKEPRALMLRHLIDSLTLLPHIPPNAHILDIGSGAGFPAIPIAVLRPDVTVTALDSTAKKIAFISAATQKLRLSNITAIHARAEELAHDTAYREKFSVVTARAVSHLRILCELSAAYLVPDGVLLAMKGEPMQTETELSESAITARVGLTYQNTHSLTLRDPAADETLARTIVTMKKTGTTPVSYPRRYSQIVKK